MLLVGIWFSTATLLHLLRVFPFGKKSENNLKYISLVVPLSRRILGVRVHVVNPEREDPKPCIYVMNHQSAFDILANLEVYPEDCIVIAKKTLAKIPVFGWTSLLANNLHLDRADRKSSIGQLNIARDTLKTRGLSIWIFPEGTRNPDGRMSKFKRGAFHMALQVERPLVPVVISSYQRTLNFNRLNGGLFCVEKLEPIETVGKTESDLDDLIELCRSRMEAAHSRLTDLAVQKLGQTAASEPVSTPPG